MQTAPSTKSTTVVTTQPIPTRIAPHVYNVLSRSGGESHWIILYSDSAVCTCKAARHGRTCWAITASRAIEVTLAAPALVLTPVINLDQERIARRRVTDWHWSAMPVAHVVTDADREDGYAYDPEGDGAYMEVTRR